MSAVKLGVEPNVTFGVTDTAWGFIQNLTKKTIVDEVELLDGDSDVAVVEQIKKRIEVTGEFIYRDTGGPDAPAVGSGPAISIDGTDYFIKEVTETDHQGQFTKVSFAGTNWPGLAA